MMIRKMGGYNNKVTYFGVCEYEINPNNQLAFCSVYLSSHREDKHA